MKKLILISVLLICSLTLTFGQATVGGWGRGIFSPVLTNLADDAYMNLNTSWGYGPRIGFTISGSSENVGAQADITFEGASVVTTWGGSAVTPALGDQQKIWVKPIEMLTISVGTSCWDDTFRGNGGFVMNNWLRTDIGLAGDDYVFVHGTGNVIVSVAPTDGLYAYAALKGVKEALPVTHEALLNAQYAVGYDIPGIGLARVQLMDMSLVGADDDFAGTVNAAFKLTMVEGLMADLGIFYNIAPDPGPLAPITVALYANYVMDTLTLHLAGDVTLFNEDVVGPDQGPAIRIGVGVEYGLEGGLTVQADGRIWHDGSDSDYAMNMAFGAFAKWSYSNGIFGVGLEVNNDTFAGSAAIAKPEPDGFVLAIPVRLEYWF